MSLDTRIASPAPTFCAEATAWPNIALIKYWGKRDTRLNLPTNSSLSASLSSTHLTTRTTVHASSAYEEDRLWIDGEELAPIPPRTRQCIHLMRELQRKYAESDNVDGVLVSPTAAPTHALKLHIRSANAFPTAAGLASSASGHAAIVAALAKLYRLPTTPELLSTVARQGSGSACRSMLGGFVLWQRGDDSDLTGLDSGARSVVPASHWPELSFIVCVTESKKKAVSSTAGMDRTSDTSSLFRQRLLDVPKRIRGLEDAILCKDIAEVCRIAMVDSNQMHACCMDAYPPVRYLDDAAFDIISFVHDWNEAREVVSLGYTFDAGPNAVLITTRDQVSDLAMSLIAKFGPISGEERAAWWRDDLNTVPLNVIVGGDVSPQVTTPSNRRPVIRYAIHAILGEGPRAVQLI